VSTRDRTDTAPRRTPDRMVRRHRAREELPVFFGRRRPRGRGSLWRGRVRNRRLRTAYRHLPINEGGDLRGDLALQRVRLIRGELVLRQGLIDPRVRRGRQRGDEAVAALIRGVVGDVAKTLARRHLGPDPGERETQVGLARLKEIAKE